MAKVITSMLKFPAEQAQKVLDKEDSKTAVSICLLLLFQAPLQLKI